MKAFDELDDLVADVIMAVLTTTASERKQLIVVLPIIFRLPILSQQLDFFGMLLWRAHGKTRLWAYSVSARLMTTADNVAPTFPSFKEVSKAQDAGHTVSITIDGEPYSRCHNSKSCTNELGQLGRVGNPSLFLPMNMMLPAKINSRSSSNNDNITTSTVKAAHAYVGGFGSAGHTAILDTEGRLWVCGCDRWQQLGLGSSQSGSSGYTWTGGRLWQEQLQLNTHVVTLLQTLDPSLGSASTSVTAIATAASSDNDQSRRYIRDVALGGDHTVILSANKRDVITFGKGAEDQLGLSSKPFVSAPTKSKTLSSKNNNLSAVCAYRNCSLTLDDTGQVISTTGKCSLDLPGMKKALDICRKRALVSGLIQFDTKQSQQTPEI
jgi:alpha-tubulin suppressor-like RCC1 family protein